MFSDLFVYDDAMASVFPAPKECAKISSIE
jgi:hypothetical protein